ncbi:hypothetical protein F0P96_18415 [Hymenobacter busanensis]|uniref:Uncharacterized protein n=1 Tax=Hymenobacter busanensis TaxID=2607656 RepID=A0A7L4ZSY0_9BACT|nr:hypothetical protein [Hymenobacter busanensis]KAA9327209.1 hypothetical protein F0P96_18415 [Hymenobacter busanensis]QHJ05876.1 hypothetical protein GUY19_00620 [Hymenobacter busanensis]
MRRRLPVLLLVMACTQFAFQCQTMCGEGEEPIPACTTAATVRNLAGLDGCGYVLELADGKRLEPAGAMWEAYPKHDGEKVTIAYADDPRGSICMVGTTVKLSCIQQANGQTPSASN